MLYAFRLSPDMPGMGHLEAPTFATVTGRVIVGPEDRMRSAMKSWPLTKAPDGVPTVSVDEWMATGNLAWHGQAWVRVPMLARAN